VIGKFYCLSLSWRICS